MTIESEMRVVAEGGLDSLRRLQRLVEAAGVPSEIVAPPAAQCSS